MRAEIENSVIEFILGSAYMEEDIRESTDEQGFCGHHLARLYNEQNRLGLALMLHTRTKHINAQLKKLTSQKPLRKKDAKTQAAIVSSWLYGEAHSCYICNRIENTFKRYVFTYFYLWKKDESFAELTQNSKGFCLEHFALLLTEGEKQLNSKSYEAFASMLLTLQTENLARLEDEIDWFTKKFEHQYANEPWKTSRDVLKRALLKLSDSNDDTNPS